jgi:DNA-binding CsgD family transcriptional regulator
VSPPRSDPAALRPVTDRQLEILFNVAQGRTNRQIGEVLGISERTVRNHMRSILQRLSSSDRTHAVVLAIGHGWMPIPIDVGESAGFHVQEAELATSQASEPAPVSARITDHDAT